MSVYEKWTAGMEKRDATALIDCLHEDYTFVRHQTGTTMNKAEMSEMFVGFMKNESVSFADNRCLYENEEVMIEHTFIDFADGSREAVLSFHQLKDAQIIRTETGATAIAK